MGIGALITGSGRRIGATIAGRLARAGYNVAIHCNHSEEEANLAASHIISEGGRAHVFKANLSETTKFSHLIEEAEKFTGPLTLLVNNASEFENDTLLNLEEEQWERHFAINLKAPVFLSQTFAQHVLAQNRRGAIVNIIDQRVWRLNPQFFSYTLTKAALWTATQTMAQSLAPYIRVNAIGPGPTLPSKRQSVDSFIRQNEALPLRRGSSPADIAEAVLFLAHSSSITGQMIAVDGGQHLAWQTPDLIGIME